MRIVSDSSLTAISLVFNGDFNDIASINRHLCDLSHSA
jgi:hypothetical protein